MLKTVHQLQSRRLRTTNHTSLEKLHLRLNMADSILSSRHVHATFPHKSYHHLWCSGCQKPSISVSSVQWIAIRASYEVVLCLLWCSADYQISNLYGPSSSDNSYFGTTWCIRFSGEGLHPMAKPWAFRHAYSASSWRLYQVVICCLVHTWLLFVEIPLIRGPCTGMQYFLSFSQI